MVAPRILKFTSCQAENSERFASALANYVGKRLAITTRFVNGIPWQQRERLLDKGDIHAGWICGLPYVLKADRPRPTMELLAAPVMAAARYAHRPIYFSDVVVRHDSTARSFQDLRGMRWGYNEPRSHSGYEVVRYHLSMLREHAGFFAKAVETGAHQTTLKLILSGKLDATAIDSTVLETEIRRAPTIGRKLRIIGTLGPSPVPPWIVSRRLPRVARMQLRSVLLSMHKDPAGRSILRKAGMARFARVYDRDYDPIRRMSAAAVDSAL